VSRAKNDGVQNLADVEERLTEVLSGNPSVRWAYLFGSAARGEPFRDLDVGVMLDEKARGVVAFGSLVSALEGAVPETAIDLVDLGSLAPVVAGRIARERRILIDRASADRKEWEVDANRRALDIEPWLREFERLRLLALEERRR
jgi:predicted nucleotidyltransferase